MPSKPLPLITDLLGDRVLLRLPDLTEKQTSGLYVLEGSQEYPDRGTVLALPTQRLLDLPFPADFLTVGDCVLFNPYDGELFEETLADGTKKRLRIVLLSSIYGIIRNG